MGGLTATLSLGGQIMNIHSQKIKKENAKRIRFDGGALQALGSQIALHGELMINGGTLSLEKGISSETIIALELW